MVMVIFMVILIVVQSTVVEMITHPLCWRSQRSRREKTIQICMDACMSIRMHACVDVKERQRDI